MIQPLAITGRSCVSALGDGRAALRTALRTARSGLRRCTLAGATAGTWTGTVEGLEDQPLAGELAAFDCRNNRLVLRGLDADGFAGTAQAAVARYGADRVGVILGTSTSGVGQAENAYQRRDETGALPADFDFAHTHDLISLVDVVRHVTGARGPSYTISTACSSSAKAFVDGAQLLAAGLCDAVIVGGVDTLCLTSLQGFNSLQLLSPSPCRPMDANRDGISIGEAAAFALLEATAGSLLLAGYGESADGYHMSSPHPEGQGAQLAMRAALKRAGLDAAAIDYVNMHGTGSQSNDRAEDIATTTVFGTSVACSATKGWTGHTLGAAGAVEAIIALEALEHGFIPGTLNLEVADPAFTSRIITSTEERPLRAVMSNNFGFGGNNASLIFTRGQS